MNKTLEEWIDYYNRKVPVGFKRDKRFALFYFPQKGFCELVATDKTLILGQTCGDGRFWKKHAEEWARELGLKVCGTHCARRKITAWIKLFGFKVTSTEEKGGLKRYHCEDSQGHWGLVTECIIDGCRQAYYVTWEV